MRGTEKIIAHIRADAQAQADEILARAEEDCARIRAEYEKQAGEAYAGRIRAGVKDCQDQVDSAGRIARMEARKELLSLKQEMVSQSFERAEQMLVGLPPKQYGAFLAKLAAKAAVTGEEEILLNARDRETLGAGVVKAANALLEKEGRPAALRLAEGAGDFEGGLILRRGSIEVNCTVELLVELSRAELSSQVAGVLFG